jgi:hypothetical protein
MTKPNDHAERVGVLVPAGMFGAGFDPATVERGLTLAPDVIAVDGGSTDSGPFYLGTGTAKTTAGAVARDLQILLWAAATAHIPTGGPFDAVPSAARHDLPAQPRLRDLTHGTERGAAYEFVLNHVVQVNSPTSMFRIQNWRLPMSDHRPMPDDPPAVSTLGDHALQIRSKNADPFWVTMEAFMKDACGYSVAAGLINETTIAALYAVPADSVLIFRISALNVVKISFPRPAAQGSLRDRDLHSGQHHIPLACLVIETTDPPTPATDSDDGHHDTRIGVHFVVSG